MNYVKLLSYYLINFVDACINLVCAIFHFYPSLELAQEYMIARETLRLKKELGDRKTTKLDAIKKADTLMEEAKGLEGEY